MAELFAEFPNPIGISHTRGRHRGGTDGTGLPASEIEEFFAESSDQPERPCCNGAMVPAGPQPRRPEKDREDLADAALGAHDMALADLETGLFDELAEELAPALAWDKSKSRPGRTTHRPGRRISIRTKFSVTDPGPRRRASWRGLVDGLGVCGNETRLAARMLVSSVGTGHP